MTLDNGRRSASIMYLGKLRRVDKRPFLFFGESAGCTKAWSGNETSYKLAPK